MLRFACGTCKERLVVPDRFGGRKGKCPNCGSINRVPLRSEFDEPLVGNLAAGAFSAVPRGSGVAAPAATIDPPPAALRQPVGPARTGLAPIASLPLPTLAPVAKIPAPSSAPVAPAVATPVIMPRAILLPPGPVGPDSRPQKPIEEPPPMPAPVLDDTPGRLVAVNPLDDAGLPPWVKLLAVGGILLLLLLAVWVVGYLLIWSRVQMDQ